MCDNGNLSIGKSQIKVHLLHPFVELSTNLMALIKLSKLAILIKTVQCCRKLLEKQELEDAFLVVSVTDRQTESKPSMGPIKPFYSVELLTHSSGCSSLSIINKTSTREILKGKELVVC